MALLKLSNPSTPDLDMNVISPMCQEDNSIDIPNQTKPPSDSKESFAYSLECSDENQCGIVRRIIDAIVYYQHVSLDNKAQFIRFCHVYTLMLSDYIHILEYHKNERSVLKISNLLVNENAFEQCNVNCDIVNRRYSDHQDNIIKLIGNENDDEDAEFMFYCKIFDSMHCYFLHPTPNNTESKTFLNNDNSDKQKNKQLFAAKKHKRLTSKFTINLKDEYHATTFMDGLYTYMNTNSISNVAISKFQQFIATNEFDSDALQFDMIHLTDRNVNNYYTHVIKKYIYYTKFHERMFSVGYRFYYWEYYKQRQKLSEHQYWNVNDHSGYTPADLYVERKYKSIKYEILNNILCQLSTTQLQISTRKANKYRDTNKVRKSATKFKDYLIYDIHKGSILTTKHLLAIILYCDWTELSAKLTMTFRKQPYQPLLDVKRLNCEFANWSRLLRETVEYWGSTGWHYEKDSKWNIENNRMKGPFYCGMSYRMVLQEYNIRLCSPTSTTKALEKAEDFSGDNGFIIQFNNTGTLASHNIRAFCCSWLSNYSSEEEWLFCGGYHRIRIENVILMQHSESMCRFLKALFYFDCMITGSEIGKFEAKNITDLEVDIMNNLIKHKLNIKGFVNKYPKYINQSFDAFADNKYPIVLNLKGIKHYFTKLAHLIMYQNPTQRKDSIYTNSSTYIIHPELFKVFINIKQITIYSLRNAQRVQLVSLLPTLQQSSQFQRNNSTIRIIALQYGNKHGRSWILDEYQQVMSTHGNRTFDIQLDKCIKSNNRIFDCLTIKAKSTGWQCSVCLYSNGLKQKNCVICGLHFEEATRALGENNEHKSDQQFHTHMSPQITTETYTLQAEEELSQSIKSLQRLPTNPLLELADNIDEYKYSPTWDGPDESVAKTDDGKDDEQMSLILHDHESMNLHELKDMLQQWTIKMHHMVDIMCLSSSLLCFICGLATIFITHSGIQCDGKLKNWINLCGIIWFFWMIISIAGWTMFRYFSIDRINVLQTFGCIIIWISIITITYMILSLSLFAYKNNANILQSCYKSSILTSLNILCSLQSAYAVAILFIWCLWCYSNNITVIGSFNLSDKTTFVLYLTVIQYVLVVTTISLGFTFNAHSICDQSLDTVMYIECTVSLAWICILILVWYYLKFPRQANKKCIIIELTIGMILFSYQMVLCIVFIIYYMTADWKLCTKELSKEMTLVWPILQLLCIMSCFRFCVK